MTVKDFVGNNTHGEPNVVYFEFYRAGNMYYRVANLIDGYTYQFTVPLEDVGNATLLHLDKAITFMRWIRKGIDTNEMIKVQRSPNKITFEL
jgi:hypothetical protein